MDKETTRKGTAARDFRDAGSEMLFEKGKSYDFGEGAFGNYFAAGLITEAEKVASTDKPLPAPTPPRDPAA